jgi:hypothetical protein
MTIDWGNVPNWIAALSGLLAWATAVGAAIIAYRSWRLNTTKAETEQAVRIAGWIEGDVSFELVLANTSDLPVYDIVAQVDGLGEFFAPNIQISSVSVLPPGTVRLPFLLANAQKSRHSEVFLGEVDLRGPKSADFRVTISFADANGAAWTRGYDGGLMATVRGRVTDMG